MTSGIVNLLVAAAVALAIGAALALSQVKPEQPNELPPWEEDER